MPTNNASKASKNLFTPGEQARESFEDLSVFAEVPSEREIDPTSPLNHIFLPDLPLPQGQMTQAGWLKGQKKE